MTDERTGPMSGIKIVDISQVVAGPLATQMLAEQGAEVIKIEPIDGELLRLGLRNGFPPLFANDNRGKRSVAVDTTLPEGRDLVLDLTRDADVFIENFRPGVSERLGLGEAAVRALAPDIIYVSVTGFGPTGPYADRACLDPVIQGLTGMVHGQTSRDLPFPDLIRTLVADKTTAYTAAQAISAALFARERGAGGQHIEIAMLDAVLAWFWPDGMSDFTLPDDPLPRRRASDNYRLTDTADGQIIYYLASTDQICGMWRALEREDMLGDDRYNHIGLGADPEALAFVGATIVEEIGKLTSAEIISRLARESVPAGPIHERADVLTDPQVVHNELIVEWEHPDLGLVRQVRPPVDFHGTPTTMLLQVEDVGASTRETLLALGRDDAEIERRSLTVAAAQAIDSRQPLAQRRVCDRRWEGADLRRCRPVREGDAPTHTASTALCGGNLRVRRVTSGRGTPHCGVACHDARPLSLAARCPDCLAPLRSEGRHRSRHRLRQDRCGHHCDR